MRKLWKEIITFICFICIYCLLIYEHQKHMENVVIKELPYVTILFFTIIFIIWISDKLKQYRMKVKMDEKIVSLCNQYDMTYDENASTVSKCEHIINQMDEKLKKDELHLSTLQHRYRKIAGITDGIIFEYNLLNDTICESSNWNAVGDGKHFIKESIEKEYVHPDDVEEFITLFEGPHRIGTINECMLRLRKKDDATYYDTHIRSIVLEGLQGEPEKVIGTRVTLRKTERGCDN